MEKTQQMEIKNYVVPVMRRAGDERSFAGTAFLIENNLLTAGHVLDRVQTYYVRNAGFYFPLEHIMWWPRQVQAEDKLGYDVAVYPVGTLLSPLSLSDKDTGKGDELEVLCWQMRNGKLEQVLTPCIVRGDADEEGYFQISTAERITHGASGCPVLKDGKVYGMLTMGRDFFETPRGGFLGIGAQHQRLMQRYEENTCWVFKSSYVKRFMPPAVR